MASLTDVAKAAGVSLTTASMVLNKGKQANRVSAACAARVRATAERLGYVPNYHARSMKSGRADSIALAMDIGFYEGDSDVPAEVELSNGYFTGLLGGVELRTRAVGSQLVIVGPDARDRAPDRGLLGIRQRRFDGVIVIGNTVFAEKTSFLSTPVDAPVVVIEHNPLIPHPVIDFDEDRGIYLAVKHLAGLGHRRLLYVGPAGEEGGPSVRELAFHRASADYGCNFDWLRPTFTNEAWPHAYSKIEHWIELVAQFVALRAGAPGARPFTGVVCYNDAAAIGVLDGLQRAGRRVPADVSVVGFDDTLARVTIPRLTTVSHQLTEMGAAAVDLILRMVNDPAEIERLRGTRHPIAPSLVVRASTAPPRPTL